MLRYRENLHAIYILLFLEAAFFLFQLQDQERYVQLFAFVPSLVLQGEVWRVLTYQFMQSGALGFFFSMLILYIMGNALEEEWGTADFFIFWTLSVLGSAAVAMILGFPLMGSFFLSYSLLFAYAATYPEMTFYIFFVLPVKVKWLAWIAIAILAFGLVRMQAASLGAAGGAAASLAWFFWRHKRGAGIRFRRPVAPALRERPPIEASAERSAEKNLALFSEVERLIGSGSPEERDALRTSIEREIKPGVNICPPPDYKPKGEDRYCIRCEGFAECTARFIRLSEEGSSAEGRSNP